MDELERIRQFSKSPIPPAEISPEVDHPARSARRAMDELDRHFRQIGAKGHANAEINKALDDLAPMLRDAVVALQALAYAIGRCPRIDAAAFGADVIAGAALLGSAGAAPMPPMLLTLLKQIAIGNSMRTQDGEAPR